MPDRLPSPRKMSVRINPLVATGVLWFSLAVPGQTTACGWTHDGEMLASDFDWVAVDAEGKPLPSEGDPSLSSPVVQAALGDRYRLGNGVTTDYAQAMRWYLEAATQGHAGAQNNLGNMYEQGLGVTRNPTEAAKWYRRAAEHGDASAQHSLGEMYRGGRGVPRDLAGAVKWPRSAAEQGHSKAFTDMGQMYWEGLGVPQDQVRTYVWWKVGSDAGDKESKELCQLAAAQMTPEKIAEAERLALNWKAKTD